MNLWLDAIAAASFAAAGALLGWLFSRLPKPYWTVGYFIPLAFVFGYRVAMLYPALSFTPPISWISGTSSTTGTSSDLLAETLKDEYGKAGLVVEYRPFKNISELKEAGLTIAVVKFGFLVDHYVTVLGVTDSEVIVGDPLGGLDRMSHEEFLKKWRFEGIVLKR
jgi:hypothetical protein